MGPCGKGAKGEGLVFFYYEGVEEREGEGEG